tara:strand:- start:309 stop:455 length:147 start_codon:yes stop_codon:yes gene_type:complete
MCTPTRAIEIAEDRCIIIIIIIIIIIVHYCKQQMSFSFKSYLFVLFYF